MKLTPLSATELDRLSDRLPGWSRVAVDGVIRIERSYAAPDYATAMAFTQLLGELSETAHHHPTVLVQREHVTVAWWTMSTKTLTQIDLTMAERTDRLYEAVLDERRAAEASTSTVSPRNGRPAATTDRPGTPSARGAEEQP